MSSSLPNKVTGFPPDFRVQKWQASNRWDRESRPDSLRGASINGHPEGGALSVVN
jgi:hypothetical protein